MKIAICASMVFAEKMIQIKRQLEELGREVFISQFAKAHLGRSETEKEQFAIHDKNENDTIRKFWEIIKKVMRSLFKFDIHKKVTILRI